MIFCTFFFFLVSFPHKERHYYSYEVLLVVLRIFMLLYEGKEKEKDGRKMQNKQQEKTK